MYHYLELKLNQADQYLTHEDVTRYFMTINEAALLVIQAGAMARNGELFILNMGKPIKIIDSKRMINLSGLSVKDSKNPRGDIDKDYRAF